MIVYVGEARNVLSPLSVAYDLPFLDENASIVAPKGTRIHMNKDANGVTESWPTDYLVGDMVLCKVALPGLELGEVYPVQRVTQISSPDGATTTVTVLSDDGEIDVCPAERFLRRTSVEATIEDDDCLAVYTFEDACEFDKWCAQHGLTRIRDIRFVEIPEQLLS